jgi:L-alanine-DL-glutamate epimerase-like enolase superfamily enzyme
MWGIAAVDVELWDLLARRLGIPAAVLFGQHAKAVPV